MRQLRLNYSHRRQEYHNYPNYYSIGTTIPVRYSKAEKIVVSPKETMAVTLTVASNILIEAVLS
jgi:hypothetical protein